jgi:glutathione peroxidase
MISSVRIFFGSLISRVNRSFRSKQNEVQGSVYDFELRSLGGQPLTLAAYRGKKMLIVNTASKCGFTYQLAELQQLHERFHERLAVLGFPSNDFLWQEPGSNKDIAEFCTLNYGVSFQMFEKISVTGRKMHPLFHWLEQKTGNSPSWNFCKYLLDEEGNFVEFFLPKVRPLDKKITDKILREQPQ